MTGRPRAYSDRQRYIIAVFWLHGDSLATIARIMTRFGFGAVTVAKVKWQIRQTPFWPRSGLSIEDRQRALDRMKQHGLDGGDLPDAVFKAK